MWWIIGISAAVVVAVAAWAVVAYRKRQIAESEQHYAEQPPVVEQDDEDEEELPVANADGFRTGQNWAHNVVANTDDEIEYTRNPEDRPGGQVYHRQVTMIEQQPPVLPDFNFDGVPDVFEQPHPAYDEQPTYVDNTPAPDPTPAYEPPAQQDTYCPPTPDPTPSYDPTPSAPAPDYCPAPAPDPTPSGNDYGGTSTDYGNSSSTDYGNSGW